MFNILKLLSLKMSTENFYFYLKAFVIEKPRLFSLSGVLKILLQVSIVVTDLKYNCK